MLGFGMHLTSATFALSGLCELVSDEFPTFPSSRGNSSSSLTVIHPMSLKEIV